MKSVIGSVVLSHDLERIVGYFSKEVDVEGGYLTWVNSVLDKNSYYKSDSSLPYEVTRYTMELIFDRAGIQIWSLCFEDDVEDVIRQTNFLASLHDHRDLKLADAIETVLDARLPIIDSDQRLIGYMKSYVGYLRE